MKSNQIPDWIAALGKKEKAHKRNRITNYITDDEMCEGEIEFMFDTFSKPKEF